jgi:hypothetical protein
MWHNHQLIVEKDQHTHFVPLATQFMLNKAPKIKMRFSCLAQAGSLRICVICIYTAVARPWVTGSQLTVAAYQFHAVPNI